MVGALVTGLVVIKVGAEDTGMVVVCVGAKVEVVVTTVGAVVKRVEAIVVGLEVSVAMTDAAVGELVGVTLVDVLVSTHKRRAKRASMSASFGKRPRTHALLRGNRASPGERSRMSEELKVKDNN